MNTILAQAIKHWDYVSPLVDPLINDNEYKKLVKQLDELLDIVGSEEEHRLMGLIDIISYRISEYERVHLPKAKNQVVDTLKYLMQANNLKQADLIELGSQGVVSEILNGKRGSKFTSIKLLAKRFNVNPATFI